MSINTLAYNSSTLNNVNKLTHILFTPSTGVTSSVNNDSVVNSYGVVDITIICTFINGLPSNIPYNAGTIPFSFPNQPVVGLALLNFGGELGTVIGTFTVSMEGLIQVFSVTGVVSPNPVICNMHITYITLL